MNRPIDLDFRPKTYFRPERLENYLLSKVKGAVMRQQLRALFDQGDHAAARRLIDEVAFSAREIKALESIHPAFMGGNYLPDTEFGEVEVARISIESTTADVTCVYARLEEGVIHYRVVDEYGGDTLQGPGEAESTQPMTLGEFHDFFMKAWPLIELLDMNFEGDLERALEFYSVDSPFYPDLGRLITERVHAHFPAPEEDDEDWLDEDEGSDADDE